MCFYTDRDRYDRKRSLYEDSPDRREERKKKKDDIDADSDSSKTKYACLNLP